MCQLGNLECYENIDCGFHKRLWSLLVLSCAFFFARAYGNEKHSIAILSISDYGITRSYISVRNTCFVRKKHIFDCNNHIILMLNLASGIRYLERSYVISS